MEEVSVGDRVEYVPSRAHAKERNAKGDFPWVLGYVHLRMIGNEPRQDIEVLSDKRLEEVLLNVARHSDRATEVKRIVPVSPRCTWPAIVRAVHEDTGTVDIDVVAHWCESYGCGNGVTLHCDGVRIVPFSKVADLRSRPLSGHNSAAAEALAHTCHKVPSGGVA